MGQMRPALNTIVAALHVAAAKADDVRLHAVNDVMRTLAMIQVPPYGASYFTHAPSCRTLT